jgi:hypothetical protein
MDRQNWEIELEKRKILQERMITEIQKKKFIDKITNGLGDEILKEPNKINKKPTLMNKIKKLLGWN